ncbi:MAG: hypothetical protein LBT04_08325 [Prevotellaceae bacterium]|jgi:hypothetical protein|nr:hypothetical protein [Prevotellaceae bacterium]
MKRYTLVVLVNVFVLCLAAQTSARVQLQAGEDSGIVVSAVADQSYTGVPFTPDVTIKDGSKILVKNVDYTLSYSNNVNVGKATVVVLGRGNYVDTKEVNFNIVPKSINSVMINPIQEQTYRASAITPDILIKDGNKTLAKDVDYTVTYSNNMNVGSASVTITGKGNYKDSKTMMFRINAKSMKGGSGRPTQSAVRPAQQSLQARANQPQMQTNVATANNTAANIRSQQTTNK